MKTFSTRIGDVALGITATLRSFRVGVQMARYSFQVNIGFVSFLMFYPEPVKEEMKETYFEAVGPETFLKIGWHPMEITPTPGSLIVAFYGTVDGQRLVDMKPAWMDDGLLRCDKPREGMKPFAWMHIDMPAMNPFETEDGNEGDQE